MHTGSLNLKRGPSSGENSAISHSDSIGVARYRLRLGGLRRLCACRTARALLIALAAVLSYGPAQAAWLGHTRIVSAAGAPLRIEVPIMGLSESDAQALRVNLADSSAWQVAGVKPPAPLHTLKITVLPAQAQEGKFKRIVLIQSDQAPAEPAVDILLDLAVPGARRQVQVSVLAIPRAPQQLPLTAAKPTNAISNDGASPSSAKPSVEAVASRKISVQSGDTLSSIARRYRPASTTTAQMLVALWQGNQKAFNQENMNLLRHPMQLALPSAEAVRAIDPAEARRTVQEQTKAFNEYRARLARDTQIVRSAPPAGRINAARSSTPTPLATAPETSSQDRLQLAQTPSTSRTEAQGASAADSRVASQKAINEAQDRIAILQKNLADMKDEMASTDRSATADTPAQGGAENKNSSLAASSSESPPLQAPEAATELADPEFLSRADATSPASADNGEMRRILFNGVLGGTAVLGLVFTAAGVLLRRRRRTSDYVAAPVSAIDEELPPSSSSALEKDGLVQKKE